jgi:hypothetical protein
MDSRAVCAVLAVRHQLYQDARIVAQRAVYRITITSGLVTHDRLPAFFGW